MSEQRPIPDEGTFDPDMTEGDEANAPQGTRAESGDLESEDRMANQGEGIASDPERPT